MWYVPCHCHGGVCLGTERATDNAASAGNLPLHLEVCDVINETDAGPKDAVAAIRKRLTGSSKNFHIINLTLTVSGVMLYVSSVGCTK